MPDRSTAIAVLGLACAACGRFGFGDAVPDRDADAGGVRVEVYADFSQDHTFVADDFSDGAAFESNAPSALCALEAPFTAPLAVIAGRSILEITPGSPTVVHDYTPATNNMSGPDQLGGCLFASTPSTGPVLWLAADSVLGGDGLYYVTPGWGLVRDAALNNVGGLVLDTTGLFTGGPVDLVFVSDVSVFIRPTGAEIVNIGLRSFGLAQVSDGSVAAVVSPNDRSYYALSRFAAGTRVLTELARMQVEPAIASDATPTLPVVAYGILNARELVAFNDDGTHQVLATADDPDSRWVAVISPPTGHLLAGAWYVVESNRSLDRDRVLVITLN